MFLGLCSISSTAANTHIDTVIFKKKGITQIMSSKQTTPEDYKFFDFLAPYRWPNKTKEQIQVYRELVETGDLDIPTLLENALAISSKDLYVRISENYRDFNDNGDSKKVVSCFRNNNIREDRWMNSFAISGLGNKIGLIRAVCYSIYQDKFYFFAIPHRAYAGYPKVEITLDTSVGYREPQGIPQGKWTRYQLNSFEELATITTEQADKL